MKNLIHLLLLGAMLGCGPAPASKTAQPPETQAAAGDSGSDLESQHKGFVEGCMQKAQSQDFCECGFEQFKVVFKDADLSQKIEPSDPRFKSLREKTVANCASKLDASQIQESFVSTCNDGDQRRNQYCSCAWASLSKSMTPAEFVSGDTESESFLAAKKTMVVACKGKFPEEAAKSDFMKGCSQQQQTDEICTCLWKKLKASFTTEEIVAGTVDLRSAPGLDQCK